MERPPAVNGHAGPPRRALSRTDATDTVTLATGGRLDLRSELTSAEYREYERANPGETPEAFERRVVQLLVSGWDLTTDDGVSLPVGGEDTLAALDALDPVVAFDVIQAVGTQYEAIYARYLALAKELGLVRPPKEAEAKTTGRGASSSSRVRGASARSTSPAGA